MIKTIYRVVVDVPDLVYAHDDYKAGTNKAIAYWIAWETNTNGGAREMVDFASMSEAKTFENQLNSLIEKIKQNILTRQVED